jgi:hypothetical protein
VTFIKHPSPPYLARLQLNPYRTMHAPKLPLLSDMLGKAIHSANTRVVFTTSLHFATVKVSATDSNYLPANISYVPLPRLKLANNQVKLFAVTSPPYALGI